MLHRGGTIPGVAVQFVRTHASHAPFLRGPVMHLTAIDPSDTSDRQVAAIVAQARQWAADTSARAGRLRRGVGLLDLTTLSATDTPSIVERLCRRAIAARVGAVCVFPRFVPEAVAALACADIPVAAVAMAFPHGQLPLPLRLAEVRYAVDAGAREIDMVISRGAALEGALDVVAEEIRAAREACGAAHLKVILETGELRDPALISAVADLAVEAGAHVLKTSTGKVEPGATPEAFTLLALAALRAERAGNPTIGLKPAGGIRTPDDLLLYMGITATVLGEQAVEPNRLRIGASSLLDAIEAELAGAP